jgi:hypothetical protein
LVRVAARVCVSVSVWLLDGREIVGKQAKNSKKREKKILTQFSVANSQDQDQNWFPALAPHPTAHLFSRNELFETCVLLFGFAFFFPQPNERASFHEQRYPH